MIATLSGIAFKFALAIVLSGAVGLERERKSRGAGLRTHILVCLGATVLMMLTDAFSPDARGRVAAGIITGIGFLGAGTIITVGTERRGLTTAAMIWFVAALGVAIGAGDYVIAFCATAAALLVVITLEQVERRVPAPHDITLTAHLHNGMAEVNEMKGLIKSLGYEVVLTSVKLTDNGAHATVNLQMSSHEPTDLEVLAALLRERIKTAEEISLEK